MPHRNVRRHGMKGLLDSRLAPLAEADDADAALRLRVFIGHLMIAAVGEVAYECFVVEAEGHRRVCLGRVLEDMVGVAARAQEARGGNGVGFARIEAAPADVAYRDARPDVRRRCDGGIGVDGAFLVGHRRIQLEGYARDLGKAAYKLAGTNALASRLERFEQLRARDFDDGEVVRELTTFWFEGGESEYLYLCERFFKTIRTWKEPKG